MKKILFLLLCILLTSCSGGRYSTQLYGYFDTVVSIDGYFESREDFDGAVKIIEDTLQIYDDALDIYNDGELKRLNEAKKSEVSPELSEVIEFGIEAEKATDGYCNVAMGSVLALWHDAREADPHYLPSPEELHEAAKHTDTSSVIISPPFIEYSDHSLSLDLGGIAKGYVADVLRERLIESGYGNMTVNLGGNVLVIGNKDGKGWKIGVQSPTDENALAEVVNVSDSSLVTSGVYQRYFEFEGKRYHHIISPDTLFPSEKYLSVSVLYHESKWADALSTALFSMSIEDGKKILEKFDGIGVLWIKGDGTKEYYGTIRSKK